MSELPVLRPGGRATIAVPGGMRPGPKRQLADQAAVAGAIPNGNVSSCGIDGRCSNFMSASRTVPRSAARRRTAPVATAGGSDTLPHACHGIEMSRNSGHVPPATPGSSIRIQSSRDGTHPSSIGRGGFLRRFPAGTAPRVQPMHRFQHPATGHRLGASAERCVVFSLCMMNSRAAILTGFCTDEKTRKSRVSLEMSPIRAAAGRGSHASATTGRSILRESRRATLARRLISHGCAREISASSPASRAIASPRCAGG